MKIGILKTKVEKLLSESYGKGTFKEEIKNFNRNVLSNKNISKLFYLYDELSDNKGYNQKLAEDFVYESVTIFENILNKTENKDLEKIRKWVVGVNSHNQYLDIDNLFYNTSDVLNLENKIKSKSVILENLKKTPINKNKETIKLPLSSMVKIANNSIDNFISELNESEKKELNSILKESELSLNEKFETLKENAIVKLVVVLETENDGEVKKTISETIDNVKTKKFDRLEYFRLKNLVDNI